MLYLFDTYALDADQRKLHRGGTTIPLEPQAFDLLLYLVRNRERVVSRDELFESIWAGRIVSDSALGARLNAVRSAVGESGGSQRRIKTFPRKGVRFIGTVHEGRPVVIASYGETGETYMSVPKPKPKPR